MSVVENGQIISGLNTNLHCPDCGKTLNFTPDKRGLEFKASHCGIVAVITPRDFIVSVVRKPLAERTKESEEKIEKIVEGELSKKDSKDKSKKEAKKAEVAQRILNEGVKEDKVEIKTGSPKKSKTNKKGDAGKVVKNARKKSKDKKPKGSVKG